MHYSHLFALALVAGVSSAAPSSKFVEHERRALDAPDAHQWVKRSRAPAEARMPVRVALKQRNLDHGHDLLMDIADPESPNFGQHLSPQEIGNLFSPHHDSVRGVRKWLVERGIAQHRHTLSAGRGFIKVDATVAEVEALLLTEYHIFQHAETGEEHIAADRYHLPDHVNHHIDFVTPTVSSRPLTKRTILSTGSKGKAKRQTRSNPLPPPSQMPIAKNLTDCNKYVTPACIRAMYGIPVMNTSCTGNELGIYERGSQYDQADLNSFYAKFDARILNGTHPVLDSIDGGQGVSKNLTGGEAMLDFELAIPLIYPQKIVLYQVDDTSEAEELPGLDDTFLDALDKSFCSYKGGDNSTVDPHYPDPSGYNHPEMCGVYKPMNIISQSYGLGEYKFTPFYEARVCHEYMKLGLAGTSAIFSSGDQGVSVHRVCLNTSSETNGRFAPHFPANCPYVTAVGMTTLAPNASVHDRQIPVSKPQSDESSGGGFSNYYARPAYQDAAVSEYLKKNPTSYGPEVFNRSGRGFPDVAAVGDKIVVYEDGGVTELSGTSASAPIFASIITLINEKRLQAGKKPVGFLNPVLYKNPQAFTDVITGGNGGCGKGLKDGFNATAGWDPVTGLGTPKFEKLLAVFMALP